MVISDVPVSAYAMKALPTAEVIRVMHNAGLHIDAGCYETSWWPHPPSYQPPGCMVDMAEKARKKLQYLAAYAPKPFRSRFRTRWDRSSVGIQWRQVNPVAA